MIAFASLLLMAIPAILLSLNLMAKPPTNANYDTLANKKAASVYFQSGTYPATVPVMGVSRTPNIPTIEAAKSINNSYSSSMDLEVATWKKSNIEQALSGVCNQIMNKCNTIDPNLLFAFMGSQKGTVLSLLTPTQAPVTLNCASQVSSDYAAYELYLLQQSVSAGDASVTIKYINYNYYYNKPAAGATGCFYVDMVSIGA